MLNECMSISRLTCKKIHHHIFLKKVTEVTYQVQVRAVGAQKISEKDWLNPNRLIKPMFVIVGSRLP